MDILLCYSNFNTILKQSLYNKKSTIKSKDYVLNKCWKWYNIINFTIVINYEYNYHNI